MQSSSFTVTAVANPLPGIFWDPREPPPPHLQPKGESYRHLLASGRQADSSHNPENRPSQSYDGPPPASGPKQSVDQYFRDERPVPSNSLLPFSASVNAQVIHDVAKVTVTHLFWNNTNHTIRKGSYTFPLPAKCTVVGFNCRIGINKVLRGKVKPKAEAQATFEDAVARDETAGMLERQNPEIFTTSLGNIPNNTRLKVEISYSTVLDHRFSVKRSNSKSLTIPFYIAERYGDPPPSLQGTSLNGIAQRVSINIAILAADEIVSISSISHDIQRESGRMSCQTWSDFASSAEEHDPRAASVRLTESHLEKDFVLDLTTKPQDDQNFPLACIETHPTLTNQKAMMLTIPPKFMLQSHGAVRDAEIIFVADRSGSMEDKIDSLKSAMEYFLKSIPSSWHFNIWCFGSESESLWSASRPYTRASLEEALAYVDKCFQADMGGTELLNALQKIVKSLKMHSTTDIVVLTDGQVWRLDDTINFVQETRSSTKSKVRTFALGVGDAVSHSLIEGIAKAGGGYSEVIPSSRQPGLESRVVAVLSAATTGHIGPLRLEVDGEFGSEVKKEIAKYGENSHVRFDFWFSNLGLESRISRRSPAVASPAFLQSPADVSTLSPFTFNRVFMLFESPLPTPQLKGLHIMGTTSAGRQVATWVPFKHLQQKDVLIHQQAARALLGDLERGQSWIQLCAEAPASGSSQEEHLVRQEGELLGCKWSLASKWTSFCAIEEQHRALADVVDPFMDVEDENHKVVQKAPKASPSPLDLLRRRGQNLCKSISLGAGPSAEVEETDDSDESSSDSGEAPSKDKRRDESDEDEGYGPPPGFSNGNKISGAGRKNSRSSGGGQSMSASGSRTQGNSSGGQRNHTSQPVNGAQNLAKSTTAAAVVPSAPLPPIPRGWSSKKVPAGSDLKDPEHPRKLSFTKDRDCDDNGKDNMSGLRFPLDRTMEGDDGEKYSWLRSRISRSKKAKGDDDNIPHIYYRRGTRDVSTKKRKGTKLLHRALNYSKSPKWEDSTPTKDAYTDRKGVSEDRSRSTFSNVVSKFAKEFKQSADKARSSRRTLVPSKESTTPEYQSPKHTLSFSDFGFSRSRAPNTDKGSAEESRVRLQSLTKRLEKAMLAVMDRPVTVPTSPSDSYDRFGSLDLNQSPKPMVQVPYPTHDALVPSYNPPPSSVMVKVEHNADERTRTIKNFISSRLLPFQNFDGSFSFNDPDHVERLLGSTFLAVIRAVQEQVGVRVILLGYTTFVIATTVSISVLLEEKCAACLELTERMSDKARDILRQILGESETDTLLDVAKRQIQSADQDLEAAFRLATAADANSTTPAIALDAANTEPESIPLVG
jgi:hypothetical protein